MQDSNQRSKTLIRELYQLSESGALDNIDQETAQSACDFIQNFLNPVVSYKQAAKLTGKSLPAMYDKVSRSGVQVIKKASGIRWLTIKRIISREI